LQTTLQGELDIRMYDASGSLHRQLKVSNPASTISIPVDVAALAPGVYVLQVSNGVEVVSRRFIKQ
jgi:hypothetical protein